MNEYKLEFSRIGDGFKGSCGRSMCRFCWQTYVRDCVLGSGDFALMAAFIDQILDAYIQQSEDRNYYEAILDGSWPSSIEQLEHALGRAKARPEAP
jgi:hypothetical protein